MLDRLQEKAHTVRNISEEPCLPQGSYLVMKASDFKRWRKGLGLSQREAADLLGLKRRMIQYYEKGQRDGRKVGVPKTVRLACYAVADGVDDYSGPPRREKLEKRA